MLDVRVLIAVVKGLLTYIPGVEAWITHRKRASRHSCADPWFCYNLWLSMLVFLHEQNIIPDLSNIGELGTSGSLGVGICALLSGAGHYTALDVVDSYANHDQEYFLSEIVKLFRDETPLYEDKRINIKLKSYDYPKHLLNLIISDEVIKNIRSDIHNIRANYEGKLISTCVPWHTKPDQKYSFIFSRAVLEHVSFPNEVYISISEVLLPNAIAYHDIELHSHGISREANGHWFINDFLWKLIIGDRDNYMNRFTFYDHVNAMREYFDVIHASENKSQTILDDESMDSVWGCVIICQNKKKDRGL